MTRSAAAMWICWSGHHGSWSTTPRWRLVLASRAERLLGGRRVDVLLLDPSTEVQLVHAAASATGVAL